MNENINSKLSLRDLDLGEVEKRTKEETEQIAYIKKTCELFGVRTEAKIKLASG